MAIISNTFNDLSLLIDLDWKDTLIPAFLVHFRNRISKALVNFFNPALKEISDPNQNRCGNAALAKILHKTEQICGFSLWSFWMTQPDMAILQNPQ